MRKVATIVGMLIMAGAALAASLPRPSPDFTIAEPGKPPLLLSSLRGKVVVMEFMFVRSAHCRRVAQILNKLNGELGSRGFQAVAVVFDPPAGSTAGAEAVSFMTSYLQLTYPVGYASKQAVDTYLSRSGDEILNIPQVVVIDRGGSIRATSGGRGGDLALEDEEALRLLIGRLLAD
jgi:thiol-disulfide isomerase/thioredoxin